jgi:Tol biopolymer transport system component/DNA-binding winged helix-turn-helix (wHTH) protein
VQPRRDAGVIRFGPFEVDIERRMLRKHGVRVKLQTQPFQVLAALLEKPGTTVTRDELRRRLWPDHTFVDCEHGLNAAVARLRQALGDSPEQPRYIETLAKLGYRFAAGVQGETVELKKETASPVSVTKRLHASWIAAAVVLAATGAGALFFSLTRALPLNGHPVPLTTFRGFEANPALSPDGNRVAFTWNGEKQDNFDIYVMPIPSGTPVRLTTDLEEDSSPAWSPDGRTIAFLRRLGDHSELILVPATGGPEHKLAETREVTWFQPRKPPALAWSPDGRWIAASHHESEEPAGGIYLFSLTGEKRRLTAPPVGIRSDNMPAFSPNGRALAFCRIPADFASEIYVLPLDANFWPSGEARRLTDNKRWSAHPVWARDGNSILHVFGDDASKGREIRIINVAHPQTPTHTIPLSDISEIAFRRRLVYSRQIEDTNIWRAELPKRGGSPAVAGPFISSTQTDQTPKYSPDGKRIAFASSRSGSREIWVSNADGSNPVRMTSFGGPFVGCPYWSPDGQWIAFHALPEGRVDALRIPAAGGSPNPLATNSWLPSYSGDGETIYFSSRRSGKVQIWKMPAHGGTAVQITTSDGAQLPIESPDGRVVYYVRQDRSEIWSIPAQGGQAVRVTGPMQRYPAGFAVTPEGIYYGAPPHAGEERFIHLFNFSTSESRPVVVAKRPFHSGISVSPDSRYLLFDQYDESGSDLMMVENFRTR